MATFDQRGQHIHGNQNNAETQNFGLQPVNLGQQQGKRDKLITILFLAANPKDTTALRLGEEIRGIDMALRQSEFREVFDIRQCWATRVADLQGCLLRHKPDIVHFSGHGNKWNEIILEDDDGFSHPVAPHVLGQVFSIIKENIRCIVLNACYSQAQAQAIAQHIDCVIGMSTTIEDTAGIRFATAFYQTLGYGRDVKTAFDLGCARIAEEDLGKQNTPQLLAYRLSPTNIKFVDDNR